MSVQGYDAPLLVEKGSFRDERDVMDEKNLSGDGIPKRVVGELVDDVSARGRDAVASELRGAILKRAPLELFPRVITFLANQRSVGTRREYKREIEDFAAYLAKRFPDLKDVRQFEPDHIVYYKAYVEARGLSPATVSRKLAALSAYFRFLASERETLTDGRRVPLIDRDLFYGLKRPRVENKKLTAALTPAQVERLLGSIPTGTLSGLLHHALVSTLFGTGLRLSAVRGIRRGDIALEDGHRVVRITTKGGKKQTCVLLPEVWASIERFVQVLEGAGVVIGSNDFIFQAPPARARAERSGEPINSKVIYSIVRRYCAQIGLTPSNVFRFAPHSARRTYATTLRRAGVSVEELQRALGHADVKTTMKYIDCDYTHDESPTYKLPFLQDSRTGKDSGGP